jgi:methylated-DNA-[protein]-cysteine S-methyltransferase
MKVWFNMRYIRKISSPVGLLTVASDGENVTGLWIEGQKYFASTLGLHVEEKDLPVFDSARKWLERYFSGNEPDFMPPLEPEGTPFQRTVWDVLRTLPYGQVVTYGDVAARIGQPEAMRAVGATVGRNPISILIPCHRVISAKGSLTGYAAGIEKKKWLLRLEKVPLAGDHAVLAARP